MKTIDVLITGSRPARAQERLRLMFTNYDVVNVYTLGAPNEGVNGEAARFAFAGRHMLDLGLIQDAPAIARKLEAAECGAVLVYISKDEEDRNVFANIEAAARIAETKCLQVRLLAA